MGNESSDASNRRVRAAEFALFGSLALLVAVETLFAAVLPATLLTRFPGSHLAVGVVVGLAMGIGLLGTPLVVPSLRRGRTRSVLAVSGGVLLLAGSGVLLNPDLPVIAIAVAALVFGLSRAVSALALLSDVAELGADSPGQGYNSSAQRLGSAAGGVVAAWAVAGDQSAGAAIVLASCVLGLLVLTSARRGVERPTGFASAAVRTLPRPALVHAWSLARSDGAIQAALLLNLVIWLCIVIGNVVIPVALLRKGMSPVAIGVSVLVLIVVRDTVSVAAGAFVWRHVRHLPSHWIVLSIGFLNCSVVVILLLAAFHPAALVVGSAVWGLLIACGISCANVVATRGSCSGDGVVVRLAASQFLVGVPIAMLSLALLSMLGPWGPLPALLVVGVAGVALSVAAATRVRRT